MSKSSNNKYSSKVLKAISRYETDAKQRLLPEAEPNSQQFLPANNKQNGFEGASPSSSEAILPKTPDVLPGEYVVAKPVSQRKNIKILIILLLIATIAWGAQWPVNKQLNLSIVITDFGKEEVIISPVNGVIKDIVVSADQVVTQGQKLFIIEPETPKELVKLHQKHLELALRLAALQIQLEEDGMLQIPAHLEEMYPHVNANLLLEHEQLLLKDRLFEQKEIDKPMKLVVNSLNQEFQTKTIERQEAESRLQEIEQRLKKTAALKKQNVVYDNGVYVEQLLETLRNMKNSLSLEVDSLKEEEAEIGSRLSDAEFELRQIQLSNKQELGQSLEDVRAQISRVLSTIRDEEDKKQEVIISSPVNGRYIGKLNLRVGDEVEKQKVIGRFQVPTDQGIAVGELPHHLANRVEIGMPVIVSFVKDAAGNGVDLDAKVIAMASENTDKQTIQIKFTSRPDAFVKLKKGAQGMVTMDTQGIPLWRHICQSYGFEFCNAT